MSIKVLVFAVLVILGFGVLVSNKSTQTNSVPDVFATPAPQVSEVNSIYGTMKLTMTKREDNGAILYSFVVKDEAGKITPIFSKAAVAGESMSLHHNSWSPNNKYVLIEDIFGKKIDYLVFKTNGENFTNGEKYLNATTLFDQKVKNYNLKEITGWDDPVLLSVRTVKGPNFWFDITTQSFIQLVK